MKAVDQENSALEQEIANLKTELELRRTLAGNSAMAIVQRHGTRAGGSRGIFEGDTTRDRLKEVQKPRSTPCLPDLATMAYLDVQTSRGFRASVGTTGGRNRGAVNVAGVHVVGSIDGWERWLHAHAAHFFVWRLLLYAATAYGWWWMRQRLRQREPAAEAHQRLLRIEIAAVTTLMLLEGSQLLSNG